MHIGEFFLNHYFTDSDITYSSNRVQGSRIIHGSLEELIRLYYEFGSEEELVRLLTGYQGTNYVPVIDLLVELERYDEAVDLALQYKDFNMCNYINDRMDCIIEEALNNGINNHHVYIIDNESISNITRDYGIFYSDSESDEEVEGV